MVKNSKDKNDPIHFIFNDILEKKKGFQTQIKNLIATLNDPGALNHIGGMLFKSNFDKESNTLHMGFVPSIIEGERSYHYNIHLAHENEFNILGVISATGEFKLLVKPNSAELSKEDQETYLSNMKVQASFLIDNGYSGEGKLDWATREVLKALTEVEDIPVSIHELNGGGSFIGL